MIRWSAVALGVCAWLGLSGLVPSAQTPATVDALVQDPVVRRALDVIRTSEAQTEADQIRFCETAAPPFQERARAALLRREFEQLGLRNVRIDRAGNVLGERPGAAARPHVMVAAHLDTVFPPETNVKVKRVSGRLVGPGIGDNCRGLAVLVALVRSMRSAGISTPGSITFVANVGEEGLGDLRGVRELFRSVTPAREGSGAVTTIDRFISIDGPGTHVTHVAVGSRRYRVTFKGTGGHSFADFGLPSPIEALGRAVTAIAELPVPAEPRTTFNVGRIGGGTSINAIAMDAWMEVDLRSSGAAELASLDARVQTAIDRAVVQENARWNRPGAVTVVVERVGDRPAGLSPADSHIVRTGLDAARALGITAGLGEASTDANFPMSLGIPAITIGGGGGGDAVHTTDEWFDPTDAWKGAQHALLLTIALAR